MTDGDRLVPAQPADEVLVQFGIGIGIGSGWTATPLVAGHINRTWRIEHAQGCHVLQWINGAVFPDPARLVANTMAVTEHVRSQAPFVPAQSRTLDGAPFARDTRGEVWRLTQFIADARTLLMPTGIAAAEAAGAGFGRFLRLTEDFDTAGFIPAIAGFHDLQPRVGAYDAALRGAALARARACADVTDFIAEHRAALLALPFAALPQRLIHGDCKISNLLLAKNRDEALAVVDLDTVMPATLLFDFGDLVRSACATAREDEPDTSRVGVNAAQFAAIAQGFRRALGGSLCRDELELMVPVCGYIAFMLGVRFITDHLLGDVYFHTERAGQNLDRARAQLRMAALFMLQRRSLEHALAAQT